MGTITGYGSKHSHEFKLTVNETSTSTANNTSEISFSFTIYKASYSWSQWNSITYNITINGTSYSGTIPSYSAGSTMTIRSGTQTVGHNNDGTKSINYSFSVNDGSGQSYTCGNASASGSMDLTTIPRYANLTKLEVKSKTVNSAVVQWATSDARDATYYSLNGGEWVGSATDGESVASDSKSGTFNIKNLSPNTTYSLKIKIKRTDSQLWTESSTISFTTYDIAKLTSAPNVNIGSSHTITWNNPSGASISLKLCKTDNSTIIDYGTITGTSKAITPTAGTIYALTPNSNTYKARYIITTTANSTSYTNSKDFTFTVTNSNPTFSNFTYKDTNGTITALTGNNQILVKGYSNVQGIISTSNKAIARNSATMKKYKMLIGSKSATANYSSSANVNISLNNVDTNVIDMYAIDSRGNSTKVSKTVTIKNYFNVSIKTVTAIRTNNVGSGVTLKFEGTFWNDSFGSVKNSIKTCKYQYKETSSSKYIDGETTLTYTISSNKITGSLIVKGDLGASGFDVSKSYNIKVILADQLSSTSFAIILGSGNPALAIYKNNVAIGQKYDTSEGSKLQVNGKSKYNDELNLKKSSGDTYYHAKRTDTDTEVYFGVGSGGVNHGIYSKKLDKWILHSDGTYVYINEINTNKLVPVLLYDNSSGTTGTVTLSETAENFSYLEIFYCDNNSNQYQSKKIYSPNGKKITLSNIEPSQNGNNMYFRTSQYTINGQNITFSYSSFTNIWVDGPAMESTAYNKIVRVIGYK